MTTFAILAAAVLFGAWLLRAIRADGSGEQSHLGADKRRGTDPKARDRLERDGLSGRALGSGGFEVSPGERGGGGGVPASKCWHHEGESAEVGGRTVPGGLLYVGRGLAAVSGWESTEPALIDPRLNVDWDHPDRSGSSMSYWPSYSGIDPRCRAAYLEWLIDGRRDPDAYIGYVFLYFYGLERRLLEDGDEDESARLEVHVLLAEIERLLSIYGDSRSFQSYASGLVDLVRLDRGGSVDSPPSEPPSMRTRGLSFAFRHAVGCIARDEQRLPAAWARAWARSESGAARRVSATRCEQEWDRLFELRYTARFPNGLALRRCKRTLQFGYRPASASLNSRTFQVDTKVPDVASLTEPGRTIHSLAEECSDALAPYSRWLGKQPGERSAPEAIGLLPAELAKVEGGAVEGLRSAVTGLLERHASGRVPSRELLTAVAPAAAPPLRKREAVSIAQALAHVGFGIEPDVRFRGPLPDRTESVVVFPLDGESLEAPSPAYDRACLLLHLASAVAAGDGDVGSEESQHLEQHVSAALDLEPAEMRRLDAHMRWLVANPPGLSGLKQRLATLSNVDRARIAASLIDIVWADGRVDPGEVRMLTRIYKLLGLDPGRVHTDLHEGIGDRRDGGPIPVRPSDPFDATWSIPPQPPEPSAGDAPGRAAMRVSGDLDESEIERKLRETATVSVLLHSVLAQDGPDGDEASVELSANELEDVHRVLLGRLGRQDVWPRDDFDAEAEALGLMPSAALEAMNELAFDRCNAPLCEGDDPIELDREIYEEMLA